PAELETILDDQVEFFADLGARRAGKPEKGLRLAGDKEHRVAVFEAELRAQHFGLIRTEVAGNRTAADDTAAVSGKNDVTEPWLALALRPGIHAVAERARAAAGRRDSPHFGLGAAFENAREHLEARAAKNLRDVRHRDRIAQIRLVAAVFFDRLAIRNAREFLGHRLAIGELLEHAADHRLNRGKHFILGDEAHFQIELIELAGRAV